MVFAAILTALVVILQFIGQTIRLGPFMISLVLMPIVIGAAVCGPKIGGWLGFVFGIFVLISGDAAAFLAVNVPGTVITVLLKGILCGLAAGIVYKALEEKNKARGDRGGGSMPRGEYGCVPSRLCHILYGYHSSLGKRQ